MEHLEKSCAPCQRYRTQPQSLTYSAGAGRCHGGARAAVAGVGTSVEAVLAELAVLPLRVALAVQAGAWGEEHKQPVSGRNWSRTFGARMGLERQQLSELTGGLGCPPAKTQPWDQSWPLLTF